MRLGIVEMMSGDFRTWTKDHTRAVRDLGFTGFGFHLDGETAFDIAPDDCRRYHEFMAGEGLDLVQFAILYRECLFSPDAAERAAVTVKINRGTEIAAAQGLILVDTKYEMGLYGDGRLTVADEIHTPDSSRF